MEIKTVAIIGLGALGVLYADQMTRMLPEGMCRVVADQTRIARYRREGVYCNGRACSLTYADRAQAQEPVDLLIFATKFNGLQDAIDAAQGIVGPQTTVVSLLNGISSERYLSLAFGAEKVLYCVAQGMDAVKEGNHLTYHSMGYLIFGDAEGKPNPRADALDAFLRRVEVPHLLAQDMQRRLWHKLLLNVGVNQACTVFHRDYGGVQASGQPRETMISAMREVLAVAQVEGIPLTEADLDSMVKLVDSLNPAGKPSMLQDAEAKRPSEVELFGGTIVRLGRKHGIPTPFNDFLYKAIKDMEAAY